MNQKGHDAPCPYGDSVFLRPVISNSKFVYQNQGGSVFHAVAQISPNKSRCLSRQGKVRHVASWVSNTDVTENILPEAVP